MSEPKWLTIARSYIGVKEVPGPQSNSVIVGWLRRLRSWIDSDSVPWCGTFCAAVMHEAGLPYPREYPRARAWADYGARLQTHVLAPGAILVFSRNGGGHVGFYVGEDATAYHVLGGNQSNAVNVMRIAKARCIATRWPRGEAVVGGPVILAASGQLSRDEA